MGSALDDRPASELEASVCEPMFGPQAWLRMDRELYKKDRHGQCGFRIWISRALVNLHKMIALPSQTRVQQAKLSYT